MSVDFTKIPAPESDSPEAEFPEYAAEWLAAQTALAEDTNLALVTVGAANRYQADVANDTSVCQTFTADPARNAMCVAYCGRAREWALAEGRTVNYRCAAGLHCFATPLRVPGEQPSLVLIGGRVFLSAREYAEFVQHEQATGAPLAPQLFSNLKFFDAQEFEHAQQLVISAAHETLTQAAERHLLSDAGRLFETLPIGGEALPLTPAETPTEPTHKPPSLIGEAQPGPPALPREQLEIFYNGSFEQGCREAMRVFGSCFRITSGALLMRGGKWFVACAAGGAERERLIQIRLKADAPLLARLREAGEAKHEQPFALTLDREELRGLQMETACERAEAFVFLIGDRVAGVLLVLDTELDAAARRDLLAVGQQIIVPLELARLRGEVRERTNALAQWQDFAHLLATRASAAETYAAIVDKAAATLGAERVSLLVLQEETRRLLCKAARGLQEDVTAGPALGEGIAGAVLESGEPLVVGELKDHRWVIERSQGTYRSESFISFPIHSGGRRLGVLNLTERVGGQRFGEGDLAWLKRFAPYAAAAMERIDLREKAQRFQMLAITDPLTGLLNRRYLEERFAEEVERAKRYQYPLSFAMMDLDGFKAYNDTFGHPAGDEVLRATAQCIKSSLRNFDVAARYGGEEFILVLPETETTAAVALAERLRGRVEQYFRRTQPAQPVTISVGVAGLSPKLQTKHQIVRAADQALYAAKKQGKNRVVVYNTDLAPDLP